MHKDHLDRCAFFLVDYDYNEKKITVIINYRRSFFNELR